MPIVAATPEAPPLDTPPTPPAITIAGLTKTFAGRRGAALSVLAGVDLTIAPGEFVTVVGPSGCGKSTLLRAVAGLVMPSGGQVAVQGELVRGPRPDVGLVFQRPVLLPWRTALENVLLPAEVLRRPRPMAVAQARELLALVGLIGFEGAYPPELSGGMQARVAVARALAHDPPILLMDEPFAAVDALTRETLAAELPRLWEALGKTVLFVTHSVPEAIFLADRVVAMTPRPGRVAAILTVDLPRPRTVALLDTPAFAARTGRLRAILGTAGDPG